MMVPDLGLRLSGCLGQYLPLCLIKSRGTECFPKDVFKRGRRAVEQNQNRQIWTWTLGVSRNKGRE